MRGPWTPNLAEARAWRVDAMARLQAGTLSAVTGPTIRDAADEFLTGIRSGAIRNRSGRPYKPSVVGSYEHHLRERVVPTFGATRLAKLTRPDVQRWIDTLAAGNLAANTVANAITPCGRSTCGPRAGEWSTPTPASGSGSRRGRRPATGSLHPPRRRH